MVENKLKESSDISSVRGDFLLDLPDYIIDFFNKRKITDKVLEDFRVGWNDSKIVFPVSDIDGNHLFNKYRRSPLSTIGPKYTYDAGGKVSLYGWEKAKSHNTILITEGEIDCLVAWSHNIPAITSTGGALSFQKEWQGLFFETFDQGPQDPAVKEKDIILCYDNDHAGAEGMVRTLEVIPWAKVMFIPDIPNVKDISDYVNMGKDLHELMRTARHFENIEDVAEDRLRRLALCQSVHFHDSYIKAHTVIEPVYAEKKTYSTDKITNAKAYPIPNLMMFQKNKARCPFHADKTPSLHYYRATNTCYCWGGCGRAYDAIDIYKQKNGVSFKTAVEDLNKLK